MLAPLSPVLFWFLVTWDVTFCGVTRGPRRTAHYVRSKVERSRACAPLTKKPVWDSGFFAHALFLPKNIKIMGFSGSVNGTTKNQGFLDFGFCQCKWAYYDLCTRVIHLHLPNCPGQVSQIRARLLKDQGITVAWIGQAKIVLWTYNFQCTHNKQKQYFGGR